MVEEESQRAQLQESAEASTDRGRERSYSGSLLSRHPLNQVDPVRVNEKLRQALIETEGSRDYYLELFDFAPVGYLTISAQGLIAEVNLTAARLLGVKRYRLPGRHFAEFVADPDKGRWDRFFELSLHRAGQHNCELLLRCEDSSLFYAQLDCRRAESDAHHPLLRVVFNDVSGRKRAEEERRVAAAAFESQEGVIVSDEGKTILRVNKAFCRITGYRCDDVIGKQTSILRSEVHNEEFYNALWSEVAIEGYWQGEIRLKRKNGETFPGWLTWTAVRGDSGQVTHYVASLSDITLQKQAEQVLLESRRRLASQVATTKDELTKIKEETAEVNTALNVLLKHREADKSETQMLFSRDVESTVIPILEKLKRSCAGNFQSIRLIGILESNLQTLVKSYGCCAKLSAAYQKLTPVEKQVASMVKQGLSTKVIAATLNISSATVSSHRKHIRKKLGLDGKEANLCSFLSSLVENG